MAWATGVTATQTKVTSQIYFLVPATVELVVEEGGNQAILWGHGMKTMAAWATTTVSAAITARSMKILWIVSFALLAGVITAAVEAPI